MKKYRYEAKKKNGYGYVSSDDIIFILQNIDRYCGNDFDLYVEGKKVNNPKKYLYKISPHTLERKIVDVCLKEDVLQNDLDSANSKVSELSNRILKALDLLQYYNSGQVCSHTQTLSTQVEEILKGSDK